MTTMIPRLRFKEFHNSWDTATFGEVAKFFKGRGISKSETNQDGNVECIRYGELYTIYKELITTVRSRTNLGKNSLFFSKNNDVIVPSSGETDIDIATASCVLRDDVALGGDLNVIRTRINGVFLSYYLNSTRKFDIARLAQGNSIVHLYASSLKTLKLNLPEDAEQQKVADFLSTVDKKIELLEQKKKAFEKYKKGVMQAFFNRTIRFKKQDGSDYPDWKECRFGTIIEEYKVSSTKNDQHPVLTSSRRGLVFQSDYFKEGNRLTDRDNKGFNIIPNGYITYRSRSDDGRFYFNQNSTGADGIISIYYPVFRSKHGSDLFLLEFLNYKWRMLHKYSVGTSQKVLSINDLKNICFSTPNDSEQDMIAKFLSELNNKIESEFKKLLTNTKSFKRALLQQMFV